MVERRIAERTEPLPKVSEKRRRLWQAVSDFIHAGGGWVTSPTFGRFVRIDAIKAHRCRWSWRRQGTACVTRE